MTFEATSLRKSDYIMVCLIAIAILVCVFTESILIKCLALEVISMAMVYDHLSRSSDRFMVESGLKWMFASIISFLFSISGIIFLGLTLRDFGQTQVMQNLPTVTSLGGVQIAMISVLIGCVSKFGVFPNLFFLSDLSEGIRKPLFVFYLFVMPVVSMVLFGELSAHFLDLISEDYLSILKCFAGFTVCFASLMSVVQYSQRRLVALSVQISIGLVFYLWLTTSQSGNQSIDIAVAAVVVALMLGSVIRAILCSENDDVIEKSRGYRFSAEGLFSCLAFILPLLAGLLSPNLLSHSIIETFGWTHWIVIFVGGLCLARISLLGFLSCTVRSSKWTLSICFTLIVFQLVILSYPEKIIDLLTV